MEKKKIKFEFSWDDGKRGDLKVVEMLAKHGLTGTFYIPSCTLLYPKEIREIASVMEIGGHTVSHPEDLKVLDETALRYEILVNKNHLEDLIGKKITKFCYPSGRYNEGVISQLKLAGYEQARTTLVLKTSERDPFRHDTTIHTYPRREYYHYSWVEMAKQWAKIASEKSEYFHLWGHTQDLDLWNYWEELDEFMGWIKENYYITNEGIHTKI